ncbi:MAG: hypothetical protein ACHWZW_12695 [Spirulina sp.]
MEILWLLICGAVAWVVGTTVDTLPSLGQLFLPSKWVLIALGLGLATWLMHPD